MYKLPSELIIEISKICLNIKNLILTSKHFNSILGKNIIRFEGCCLKYTLSKIIRKKLCLPVIIKNLNIKSKFGWTFYYEEEYNLDMLNFNLSGLFSAIKIRPLIFYTNKIIAKLYITCKIASKHSNIDRELFCFEIDMDTDRYYILNDFIVYSLKEIIRRCSTIKTNYQFSFGRLVSESMLDLTIKYSKLLDYDKIQKEQKFSGIVSIYSINQLSNHISDKFKCYNLTFTEYITMINLYYNKPKQIQKLNKLKYMKNQRKDLILASNKNKSRNFHKRVNLKY